MEGKTLNLHLPRLWYNYLCLLMWVYSTVDSSCVLCTGGVLQWWLMCWQMVGTTGLATLVSPTIQLLAPSGLRMLPGDPQPLALTVHPPHLPTTSKCDIVRNAWAALQENC
jgi:hypothetical protein